MGFFNTLAKAAGNAAKGAMNAAQEAQTTKIIETWKQIDRKPVHELDSIIRTKGSPEFSSNDLVLMLASLKLYSLSRSDLSSAINSLSGYDANRQGIKEKIKSFAKRDSILLSNKRELRELKEIAGKIANDSYF